ncbi:hypothetical protein L227DRAFT_195755 [Lentinus tigrinus ALCF2SS1-6]|uniref:Uncharacterized protein n=1 Tax=Lentinus tigrinus ALCF2SS1-6 TaxID=1328759 RepID=A0A5C2S3K1_9APHY|nr:hypothetical protein L227DRAFT_195755 [Lentinus tigrinus ALCF2SS1-6]
MRVAQVLASHPHPRPLIPSFLSVRMHIPRPCPRPVTSRLIWIRSRPSLMISSLLPVVVPPPCIVVSLPPPSSPISTVSSVAAPFGLLPRFPCGFACTHYIYLPVPLPSRGHPPSTLLSFRHWSSPCPHRPPSPVWRQGLHVGASKCPAMFMVDGVLVQCPYALRVRSAIPCPYPPSRTPQPSFSAPFLLAPG